ncbi:polyamine aminopropyltransferase [Caproiciproducens galactitolivorans]|uniref:Polyamine aminopropyltransferase n=1 Tax=Caproiciproducens galactitolivorans TaxID=642589 RepID=A0ABT4BT55_9FIRM|nr:polyamine aminopropyltransferase [Caproiciproducens galactitolivorans]MCY1714078.1 polyamine aminopropyltransferase [Caproiciproducens galactitolivorans]
MDLWFTEQHTKDVCFSIRVEKQIHSEQSKYQRIDVFESKEFGRFLTIDGKMMLTEKDEFIYHEMIVHVPMAVNPGVKNVLVIGGGDGGTIRELTRYGTIEKIDLVEVDKRVLEVSRAYFPEVSEKLSDKRISFYFEDGLRFIREKENEYDLIIVDSTDPFGPGEGLFTKEFYGSCCNALKENGILVNQQECPYYADYSKFMKRAHQCMQEFFPVCRIYQAQIPSYPSGNWVFGFASKGLNPVSDLRDSEWNKLGLKTRYYNTDVHVGSFAIPNYIRDILADTTEQQEF